ncbi:hypothetical protein SAMN06264364_11510 [Quadrisphaera granulorum]|uniref:Uncharacterized protein n=1 Tax=Quadrisphaera granulorum TaxID=317664 RepID=A0A316A5Z3_9ACTN|nr:hypothetical protein [Quadrisphaera granulorum]PWJ52993.1 hypothetical protein BXY45_11510 [Quadrisphaera granulorum]SZE97158.1 hypothetical protein SAMN06264364_11510 [Quadrisphaera granulorum]
MTPSGATTVTIGTVFEAATLLGLPLFGAEGPQLGELARRERHIVALLPQRVTHSERPVDDDF